VSDEPESADPDARRREPHYGPVLVLLVAFPAIGAVSASRVGTAVSAIMVLALWVAIIRATGASRALLRGGLVVGVILAVVAVLAAVSDRNGLLAAVELVVAGGVFAILVMLLKALVRERSVTLSTIAGVLSAYLLIGLFFTGLYAASALLDDGAFASVTTPLERFDLLYFSFITLATVGYGDITPLADPTRSMAMTEAVTGQLFLVTVVARVVALFPGRAGAG
jgi:hypothetical protein